MTSNSDQSKRLLFFSLEDWNEVWRRNQFVCAELCKRYPDLSILWVGQSVDVLHSIRKGAYGEINAMHATPRAVPHFAQIKTLKPLKPLPNVAGRKINLALYSNCISNALRSQGWLEAGYTTWVNNQYAARLLPLNGSKSVIYDITDDWTQIKQTERQLSAIIEEDACMLSLADHVIVCSPHLEEIKGGKCKDLKLISNGVDCERYHPDNLSKLEPAEELKNIPGPIIGYTGTLHEDRLDLILVEAVADLLPEYSFVLVGPAALSTIAIEQLKNRKNIYWLGAKPYQRLPNFICRFDACMTPHLVNTFTESLDPLKMYEYMSTGKPIISTPCAGFREQADLVALGAKPSEFADAIKRELASHDADKMQRRLDWAKQHSWQSKVDQIVPLLGF